MGRLNRAETQARTRAKVLSAAKDEFAEHGFRDAKIDRIADRAELTRGAVYSNFPGKRALYFAVLAEDVERAPKPPDQEAGRTAGEALGALARVWVTRLPLATDEPRSSARLGLDVLPEILADERTREVFAHLLKLDAILLGLALERLRPHHAPAGRLVRVAETALTTLYGASLMAAGAPGFLAPFDVISVCEHLAGLDLEDEWPPPHLQHVLTRAQAVDEPWLPPGIVDAVRAEPARLTGDGVVAVLGLQRLEAAEEAIRAAPFGAEVTAVLVTSAPDEFGPLARLTVADLCTWLRQAFPPSAWPRLQVVHDDTGALAAAAGVPNVTDLTETGIRIEAARIVARAEGRGSCHAVAAADRDTPAGDSTPSSTRRGA